MPSVLPRQIDRDRQQFWRGFAARFPELRLGWGNTFARWRDVPATELIVSYNIAGRGVGLFVRGQRGVLVRETAGQLPGYSLEVALGCPIGNPNFPFLSWLPADTADPATWPTCHDWLFAAGDRYVMALARVVGGVE